MISRIFKTIQTKNIKVLVNCKIINPRINKKVIKKQKYHILTEKKLKSYRQINKLKLRTKFKKPLQKKVKFKMKFTMTCHSFIM